MRTSAYRSFYDMPMNPLSRLRDDTLIPLFVCCCVVAVGCNRSNNAGQSEAPVQTQAAETESKQAWLHGLPEGITVLNDEVIELGSMTAGDTVSRTLNFSNTTDQVLVLKKPSDLSASCNCTKADLSADTIQPGETATVNLSINTANIHQNGENKQMVRVVLGTEQADSVAVARYLLTLDISGVLSVIPTVMETTLGPDATRTVSFQLNTGHGVAPDWSSVKMSSTNDSFSLRSIEAEGTAAQAIVEIDLGTQAFAEGQVLFMLPTNPGHTGEWSEATPYVSAIATVRATSEMSVSMRPQQLTVIFSGESSESKTTKLLLQGQSLDAISIDDRRVQWWEPRRLSANQVLLQLRFNDALQGDGSPLPIQIGEETVAVSVKSSRVGSSGYSPIN